MRAVRNRHTVRGAQTAEAVTLHGAGKALTDRRTGHVDELARREVSSLDLGANVEQVVVRNTEFNELGLGLNACDGEMTAKGLRRVLNFSLAGTQLNCGVAILSTVRWATTWQPSKRNTVTGTCSPASL